MQQITITFIGGGNMARSLIGGLIKQGHDNKNICVIEPDTRTAAALSLDFSILTYPEAAPDNLKSDYIILAVKPQSIKSVCKNLANKLPKPAKLISIAAGITSGSMSNWLNDSTIHIIRAMPNTPALVGLSATGLFSAHELSPSEKESIDKIFSSIGLSIWVNKEKDMDTVTALSGSGPAYFFLLCEHLISAAIREGLNVEQAQKLVIQTAVGSAHMALMSSGKTQKKQNPIHGLREKVTSKGGTTEAGVKIFEAAGFEETVADVIKAAKKRSIELSDDYGK